MLSLACSAFAQGSGVGGPAGTAEPQRFVVGCNRDGLRDGLRDSVPRSHACAELDNPFRDPPLAASPSGEADGELTSQIGGVTVTDDSGRRMQAGFGTGPPDTMFGPPDGGPTTIEIEPDAGAQLGGRLICVRTCDGYFFPLDVSPANGDESALCQALCPGAETSAFRIPDGPADLERAVSLSGRSYWSLPGAYRYQTHRSPTCGCKGEGQAWAPLLGRAESMIARKPGDILVTEGASAAMSRPGRREARPGSRTPRGAASARAD